MTSLSAISEAIGSVASAVAPSVVGVAGRRGGSGGSGIVVASGRVLTNAHNLRGDLTVTFADGRSASPETVHVDADGDMAIVEVDTRDAPALGWKTSAVAVGEPVFGVANPDGRGLRVTFGLVSSTEASFRGPRGRRIAGSIEHTAPLLPGSSGGPITDEAGRVVGINTHRLGDGFYLAIPADDALRQRVDALSRGEEPSRPRLGVALAPADVTKRLRRAVGLPQIDGLLVRAVEDDSPAASAGLREGDVLLEAAGRTLATVDDLLDAMTSADATVSLRIVRGTEDHRIEVTL